MTKPASVANVTPAIHKPRRETLAAEIDEADVGEAGEGSGGAASDGMGVSGGDGFAFAVALMKD